MNLSHMQKSADDCVCSNHVSLSTSAFGGRPAVTCVPVRGRSKGVMQRSLGSPHESDWLEHAYNERTHSRGRRAHASCWAVSRRRDFPDVRGSDRHPKGRRRLRLRRGFAIERGPARSRPRIIALKYDSSSARGTDPVIILQKYPIGGRCEEIVGQTRALLRHQEPFG